MINYQSSREAFLNALLAKKSLKSNNINIDYQLYTASAHYLIKSVGFNASNKFAPEDFVTFHVYPDFVIPSFGQQISHHVKALFTDLIHF